jgi:hypothetical protein
MYTGYLSYELCFKIICESVWITQYYQSRKLIYDRSYSCVIVFVSSWTNFMCLVLFSVSLSTDAVHATICHIFCVEYIDWNIKFYSNRKFFSCPW